MELKKSQSDIVKVCLGLNIISLILSIFFLASWVFYTTITVNIVLLISYIIITKYFFMIAGLTMANKFARKINDKLEVMNG